MTKFEEYYNKTKMMDRHSLINHPYIHLDDKWLERQFLEVHCADCPLKHVISDDGYRDCRWWIYDQQCHAASHMTEILRIAYACEEMIKDEFYE